MATHVFGSELICGEVDGAVGPAADLLDNGVLVDLVVGSTIVFVAGVFNVSIQSFLLSC